jgi:hypothetical protein
MKISQTAKNTLTFVFNCWGLCVWLLWLSEPPPQLQPVVSFRLSEGDYLGYPPFYGDCCDCYPSFAFPTEPRDLLISLALLVAFIGLMGLIGGISLEFEKPFPNTCPLGISRA